MNRYRGSFAAELVGIVGAIWLVVLLISLFVLVKAILFVVRTFAEHYRQKALWIALCICVVLVFFGMLFASRLPALGLLAVIGIGEFLITCMVVSLKHRTTLLREQVNVVDEVLHSSWWSSEDEPIAA